MADVKLVVIYPRPKDVDAFEKIYSAASVGGKETLANAVKISTGGMPIFLVAEAETFTFTQTVSA